MTSFCLARISGTLGGLVIAAAVSCALALATPPPVIAAGMLVSATTVLALGAWTWRRGDSMGAWVLAAHVPLIASTGLIVSRMFGIQTIPFRTNVLVAVSMG